jgi:aspartate-semialdehyde dehydrogenase
MGYRVAVVGATGRVGGEMLNVLAERLFDVDEVAAVASERSAGKEVSFGESDVLTVQALDTFDFNGWDLALFSPGAKVSAEYAPKAAAAGCPVIDNTSQFRMDPDVPLVVPEVNPDAVSGLSAKNIIANPNCSTIQLVVALKPLHDRATIKRVIVSTYQSTSGAGGAAMDELFNQTKGIFTTVDPKPKVFPKQIAFNVIPHIDMFMEDGYTKEEWKMMAETKKILADEARDLMRKSPGLMVVDSAENEDYVTPIESAGEDATFVSRIRDDPTVENGLSLWVVADNLRKGAALNSVQIAELLVNRKLLRTP